MKKYLVITIDVEPDCSPSWRYSKPLTFHGMDIGIGQRLQPLFNKYDAKPTYLLNNVVMEDKNSVQFLKKLSGRFELGTHLHPEFIAPEKEFFDYAGQVARANCCQYNPKIEYKKLENITRLFERSFDYSPTSFRAGRFAAAESTMASLIKLGYKADTSVTPNLCWRDKQIIRADYRKAWDQPYFIDQGSILEENPDGPLLQVPVGIVPPKFSLVKFIWKSIQKRKPARLSPVWLRPGYSGIEGFKWVIDYLTEKHASKDAIVYNVMFHNVEVLPNLSPSSKTEEECSLYLQSLEWLLSYCKKEGIEIVGLSDLYDVYKPKANAIKILKKNSPITNKIITSPN